MFLPITTIILSVIIVLITTRIIFDVSSENLGDWFSGTDDVDRVICSLKHGKAAVFGWNLR